MTPFRLFGWLALLLAIPMLAACERNSPAANAAQGAPPPPKVTAAKPIVRDVTQWDQYTGRLEAVETVEVKAQVSGFVDSVHFQEGTIVKKGDLLLTIDARIFQSQVDNAKAMVLQAKAKLQVSQANLKLHQSDLKRAEEAMRSGAMAPEELETRRATVVQDEANIGQDEAAINAAEAAVKTAAQYVDWCQVTAPIAGRISDRRITPGNMLNGGAGQNTTVITTITSLDPIYCYFDADEANVLKYQAQALKAAANGTPTPTPCYMGLVNEEGYPHAGTIDFLDNRVNPGTASLRERGVFKNPDGLLLPGLYTHIRVPGQVLSNALLILDEAVGTDQDKKYLYVLHRDKTIERRIVQVGPIMDELRVITANLKPDEIVLIDGLTNIAQVRPGGTVDPTIIDMPEHHLSPLMPPPGPAGAPTSAPATTCAAQEDGGGAGR